MNHLSPVGEPHSVTAAIRNNDGPRRFVGFMPCPSPIPLELQMHLYPARKPSAGLL